jgi:hypothetical protein
LPRGAGAARARPRHALRNPAAMVAIAAILVFIVAVGALNWFEFGRID